MREVGGGQRPRSRLARLEELERDLAGGRELWPAPDDKHAADERERRAELARARLEPRQRALELPRDGADPGGDPCAATAAMSCEQRERGDLVGVRLRGSDRALLARGE